MANILELPDVAVDVLTPDVGGGFGTKVVHPYPEEVLVPWAARLLDREVTELDDDERLAIVTALSHLDSSTTWVTMRHELGMRGRDIADAAAWAAEAVLDPLRARAHQG